MQYKFNFETFCQIVVKHEAWFNKLDSFAQKLITTLTENEITEFNKALHQNMIDNGINAPYKVNIKMPYTGFAYERDFFKIQIKKITKLCRTSEGLDFILTEEEINNLQKDLLTMEVLIKLIEQTLNDKGGSK